MHAIRMIVFCCCIAFPVTIQQPAYADEHDKTFRLDMVSLDSGAIRQLILETDKWRGLYPDSALKVYVALIEKSKEIGYASGIMDAMQPAGALFASKGMYETSMRFFHEMHEYCKRSTSLWICLPVIYNGIATLHHTQGNYRQAANFYYQSIVLNEELTLPPPIGGYNNLAAVLMSLGQYDEALYYLERAESNIMRRKQHQSLGSIINNKGQIWLVRKDWDKSAQYFNNALAIGREQNLPQLIYAATTNLGTWHLWQEQYEKALQWYFKDTGISGNIDPLHICTRDQNIGTCYLKMNDYVRAEEYFLRALAIAQALKIKKNEMELHNFLAAIYEAKKEYEKALSHHKGYAQLKDSIANLQIIDNAQQLNIKFRTAEKDRKIAQNEQRISMQEVNLKKKNVWISSVSLGILLLGTILLFSIRHNRQKQKLHDKQLHILGQQQQIGRLNALMQGEEQERIRIARDLHDGIGGMLAAVKMNFTTLQHEYEQYAQSYEFINPDDLYKIREMIDETGKEVRKTAHNLMPDVLVRHGLYEALKVYCDHINAGNQLYVNLQITGNVDETEPSFKLSLYRIIQELVQNILKHSEASNALVQINRTKEIVAITVKDNGVGFDQAQIPLGVGLQNIRSRIQAVQGSYSLSSAVGAGTRVDIIFDLREVNKSSLHENTDSNSR